MYAFVLSVFDKMFLLSETERRAVHRQSPGVRCDAVIAAMMQYKPGKGMEMKQVVQQLKQSLQHVSYKVTLF